MDNKIDSTLELTHSSPKKTIIQPSKKKESQKDFSSSIPKRFCSHTPQAITHIINHFPLLTSDFLSKDLLKLLLSSKESLALMIDDSKEQQTSFPATFSPSLDITLVATLAAARYSGKVVLLVVPNTSIARKINEIINNFFGSHCQVATTINSLSDNVSCELFGDSRIILSTYSDFLRKLLTKDLPSIHSIIFYQPLNHQNNSLLTSYMFDIMLLRLEFSSRSNSSFRKIFLCDPSYFNPTGYQLLTNCSNIFSFGHSQSLDDSLYTPDLDIIYKHAFILMFGLLFKRHLTRKQLFTELRSSFLYRSLLAVQEVGNNIHSFDSSTEEFELLFEKQLYKAFILLSHPSLGPFTIIKKSKNRYTLSSFGEEFLTAVTYSSSSLIDIINLIDFLCSTMKEKTLSWDSFLKYLMKSFPVNNAYNYNQSFNQLIAFIKQVKEIYNSMSDLDFDTLSLKSKNKLSKLLHSRKYSFGDFQNMKILKCVGQRFANDTLAHSLQAIDDQILKSFYSEKSHQKKKVLYNKQKLQELVLSEVLSSDKPQTVSQVALSLNLKKHLTDSVLRSFSKHEDAFIVSKTVTTANGRRTFFGTHQNFPINFDYTCFDCQFYSESGICTIFSTLGRLAPHKLPYLLRKRSDSTLKPGTFTCFKYSPKKLRTESFTLEAFGNLTREVQGLTNLGAIFHHKCIYCSSVIEAFGTKYQPLIGTSTISCFHCGSLYKLSRTKTKNTSKKIMVKCQEGNLNAFENTLYELSGLVWDEHKRELTPLHGMTIRYGEKVSLEGDYIVIENIRKKVDELEYLYSSIPLSQKIIDFLEQKGVQVKFNPIALQKQTKISNNDKMTSEQALAIQALRVSCIFNNPFLQANLYSRWGVTIRTFLLLEKDLTEENLASFQLFGFEWYLLDILKLSSNALHPYTIRICEGLAGNIMWLFLKEVFGQKQLDLFTRVRDRYVKEKEFYPNKRTLAYSAISALTNFFLILIQDYLKILHKKEGIPWKGSLGLIHGTKKASALYELGFFLDFIDPIKIAALYFLAKAITDDVISFSDVEEFLSPSGATLYAVKFNSISKLESLVHDFFSENVVYSSKEVSFEEAYILYLRNFFELMNETIIAIKNMNLTIEGIDKSAFSWLQSWDNLSCEKREIIASNLHEKLPDNLTNSNFEPFNYLPSFLQKRFNSIQSIIQSLEKFSLFNDWEKRVLSENNIQTFLYQDNSSEEDINGFQ